MSADDAALLSDADREALEEDVAVALSALLAGRIDGPQAVASICAMNARTVESLLAAHGRRMLEKARDDIKARIVTFSALDADPQYINALHDAWGLVANRARAARIGVGS